MFFVASQSDQVVEMLDVISVGPCELPLDGSEDILMVEKQPCAKGSQKAERS